MYWRPLCRWGNCLVGFRIAQRLRDRGFVEADAEAVEGFLRRGEAGGIGACPVGFRGDDEGVECGHRGGEGIFVGCVELGVDAGEGVVNPLQIERGVGDKIDDAVLLHVSAGVDVSLGFCGVGFGLGEAVVGDDLKVSALAGAAFEGGDV